MASNGKKKPGESSGGAQISGPGAALVFTGGALVGAAVLYGMKKLYDSFKKENIEEKKLDDKEFDQSSLSQQESHLNDLAQTLDYVEVESPTDSLARSIQSNISSNIQSQTENVAHTPTSIGSLHDSLYGYYTNYVDIPVEDYEIAMTVVEDVKESFKRVAEELMPNCPFGELINIGSASEGLAVVRPDTFQVSIQILLDPKLWSLVDAGQTLLAAHGYQMVKRNNLEFFSRGTSYFDRYLIGEYLSPVRVKAAFLDLTNRVRNWGSSHKIRSTVIGPEVKLIVNYGYRDVESKMEVDFVPSVTLNEKEVLAQPHSKCSRDSCYENLWMQSFRKEELRYLTEWKPTPVESEHEDSVYGKTDGDGSSYERDTDLPETKSLLSEKQLVPGDIKEHLDIQGCQLMCLKILEAVRLNHPVQMSILTPYMVRTIILKLLAVEDGWYMEQLSERFLDTLKFLEESLRHRKLSHYICPSVNLMEGYEQDSIDYMRDFIAFIIGNNQFGTLLKTDY